VGLCAMRCRAKNWALSGDYERAGFDHRGHARVRGSEVSLYERKVGAVDEG
jgi:alpha-beta hydrolase superfamily lysophospholipase